jgi:copper chaperone NosL
MKRFLAILAVLSAACTSGPPAPAALDTRNESCGWCRMAISEARFAGQIVAPSEEPRFFDDIGCLAHYVAGSKALPRGAIVYVADHRTRDWVRADAALYMRIDSLATPMGSHLIAHADAASRDADPVARGGMSRTPAEVFSTGSVPGGGR